MLKSMRYLSFVPNEYPSRTSQEQPVERDGGQDQHVEQAGGTEDQAQPLDRGRVKFPPTGQPEGPHNHSQDQHVGGSVHQDQHVRGSGDQAQPLDRGRAQFPPMGQPEGPHNPSHHPGQSEVVLVRQVIGSSGRVLIADMRGQMYEWQSKGTNDGGA